MPNHNQILFLVSFFGVFGSLVLISNYIGAKLKAAGYDVSRIILIGLDTNGSTASTSTFALPWGSNMTSQVTFDLKDFQEKGYAQIAALVLALLSSVFIYLKFGATSEYMTPFGQLAFIYFTTAAERKPVLDPAVWKEFTLSEKIVVSSNTAM
jgi:cytochrome-b5 reductase